jgi:hypothetical protein
VKIKKQIGGSLGLLSGERKSSVKGDWESHDSLGVWSQVLGLPEPQFHISNVAD